MNGSINSKVSQETLESSTLKPKVDPSVSLINVKLRLLFQEHLVEDRLQHQYRHFVCLDIHPGGMLAPHAGSQRQDLEHGPGGVQAPMQV